MSIGVFFAGTVQLRSRVVVRLTLFTLIAFVLGSQTLPAQHPPQTLIVAADQSIADAILPLCGESKLTVLVKDRLESHRTIEARALRFLNASIFVMGPEPCHESLPIFAERFRNHGIQIVRLPASRRVAEQKIGLPETLNFALLSCSLASH